jgi:hypothetical protein
MKILVSLSVGYEDIGSTKPVLKLHRPKRRFGPRRKLPKPFKRLDILKRKLGNIRSQIKQRLNATTFRLGDPKKLSKKKSETISLYLQYKRLKQQIEKIEQVQKTKPRLM